jgi:serine/threonine protein kinase
VLQDRALCIVMPRYTFTLRQLRDSAIAYYTNIGDTPIERLFEERIILHIALGVIDALRHIHVHGFAHRLVYCSIRRFVAVIDDDIVVLVCCTIMCMHARVVT